MIFFIYSLFGFRLGEMQPSAAAERPAPVLLRMRSRAPPRRLRSRAVSPARIARNNQNRIEPAGAWFLRVIEWAKSNDSELSVGSWL